MKYLIIASALVLGGCGTTGQIHGRFVGADGAGIPNAEVVFWKRGALMELPERVVETTTDKEGRFSAFASKRVHSVQARTPVSQSEMSRMGVTLLWPWSSNKVVVKEEPNQRPERNAGATSPLSSKPPPGVAHP